MSTGLVHRGPDSDGTFIDDHLTLSVRRLKIIDLATGDQPLYNEDQSLVLVANGEIYNFVELRRELESRGHRFATFSDCETILHLYEERGMDCVHRLRGMFAFALWDQPRKRLMIARDRMGEKPLYLCEQDGRLLFASELKALLGSGLVPFELDPAGVDLYFHYQYVPEPMTPLRGVRKLDAGHLVIIDVDRWSIEERRYWAMEEVPPVAGDPVALIREEMDTIGRQIIRADVPVGVALSGGLDSSAVAALAAHHSSGRVHAFSVGYSGRPRGDERDDAQALARHLRMPFHDVELRQEDVVMSFPDLVYLTDDPVADIAGSGYLAVARLAREHGVPVLLQGQGGDELFWGYSWVRQAARESHDKAALRANSRLFPARYLRIQARPWFTRRGIRDWAASLAGVRPSWQRYLRDKAAPPDRVVFYDLIPDFANAERAAPTLYGPAFAHGPLGTAADLFTFPGPWSNLDVRITRLICDTYLRGNGVVQADRLSMASSIETRLPLLDYRLVELVIGLRKTRSDRSLEPKAWLRRALRGLVPDWVSTRPKRGFTPPVADWHRALFTTYGGQLVDGYLVESGILRPEAARELALGRFPSDTITPLTFKALVLEVWCRRMRKLA